MLATKELRLTSQWEDEEEKKEEDDVEVRCTKIHPRRLRGGVSIQRFSH